MSGEFPLLRGKPLESYRVVDLKEELERFGLSKSGNKKELIARLGSHLLQNAPPDQDEMEQGEEGSVLPSVNIDEGLSGNDFVKDYLALRASQFAEATDASPKRSPQKAAVASPPSKTDEKQETEVPVDDEEGPESVQIEQQLEKETKERDEKMKAESDLKNANVKEGESSETKLEEISKVEELKKDNQTEPHQGKDEEAKKIGDVKGEVKAAELEELKESGLKPEIAIAESKSKVDSAKTEKVDNKDDADEEDVVLELETKDSDLLDEKTTEEDASSKPQPEELKEKDQKKESKSSKEATENEDEGSVTLRKIGKAQERHKRHWNSKSSNSRQSESENVENISSKTLKDIIPDIKPLMSKEEEEEEDDTLQVHADEKVDEVHEMEEEEQKKSDVTEKLEVQVEKKVEEEKEIPPTTVTEPVLVAEEGDQEDDDDTGSCFISVTDLVRPFTINQLKELLARTGEIEDFAINKIKSKCVVKFRKPREAKETKSALDGVRWPSSNPKTLVVDFTTEDDLKGLKEIGDKIATTSKESEKKSYDGAPDAKRRKLEGESKESSHGQEQPEAKPLETLFRRTKATPNIYWKMATPKK